MNYEFLFSLVNSLYGVFLPPQSSYTEKLIDMCCNFSDFYEFSLQPKG